MAGATTAGRERARAWSPARGSVLLLAPPLALLLFLFVAPLAVVLFQSVWQDGFTLASYAAVLGNAATLGSLGYTFRIAATVTVAALLLSYPVAYIVSRAHGSLLHLAVAMILVPFWTSTVIRTYAWIVVLQRRGILNDLLMSSGITDQPLRLMNNGVGLQIAMVHIMLPFMILPLLSAMRGIDETLLRAASVLGANPLRQFISVYLPLSLPGVAAGCSLVFISSLGFYITPALIGGPNMMVAVVIEQQASRLLNWPLASALATILLVLTCLMFLIYERMLRRLGAGSRAHEVE
ncbi:MAG: ABC transporter permease [Geminicoccaceae bacterium]